MDIASFDLDARLAAHAAAIETLLSSLLDDAPRDGETARPPRLLAAMRHGTLGGGKRLRPFLVIESTRLLGGEAGPALRVAAALECVHCYSLIHDDLPSMDDDALRRGRPTVHVAFDEATAILAGDALQALAFDVVASPETDLPAAAKVELMLALARAAGLGGMVGGQVLDLEAETTPPDEPGIVRLQAMKTGALIRFACEAGAVIAGASADDRARLRRFGETMGLAFQLADDLLDVTASTEELGKAAGKDAGRGKGTLVAIHGVEWSRARLRGLVAEAGSLLAPYGGSAAPLLAAARYVAERKN
ncbi:MAG: polyprenyl synthetase family protein [Pararhizobium sp.]